MSFYICISVVFEFSDPSFYTTYVYIPSILFSWVPTRNIINRHPPYLPIYLPIRLSFAPLSLFFFYLFTWSKEFSNVIGIFLRPPFIRVLYASEFRTNFISGPQDIFPKWRDPAIRERWGGSDAERQNGENSRENKVQLDVRTF